jgi:hypothetical protein
LAPTRRGAGVARALVRKPACAPSAPLQQLFTPKPPTAVAPARAANDIVS